MNRRELDRLVDEHVALNAVRAAAPMVQVTLHGDCSGRKCPTVRGRAKLDTGAAHTFFAPSALKKLKVSRTGKARVRGLGGAGRTAQTYAGYLTIAGLPPVRLARIRGGHAELDRRGDVALIGRKAMADTGLVLEYDAAAGALRVRSRKKGSRRRSR